MSRPTYSPELRAEVIALAVEVGPAEAARRHGLNPSTVASWSSKAGMGTVAAEKTRAATLAAQARRQTKREELRRLLLDKAVDLVKRMDEPHIDFKGKDADEVTYPKAPAQACQQYATAAGILIDKFRLELGEATAWVVTEDAIDTAIRSLETELGERAVGEAVPAP